MFLGGQPRPLHERSGPQRTIDFFGLLPTPPHCKILSNQSFILIKRGGRKHFTRSTLGRSVEVHLASQQGLDLGSAPWRVRLYLV